MSAYIVNEVTMAKVVDAIATADERQGVAIFTESATALARAVLAGDPTAAVALADEVAEFARGASDPNGGLTRLGRELYAMNQAAIIARNGDRPDDDYQAVPDFRFTPELLGQDGDGWRVDAAESPAVVAVRELIYKCSEGDVPSLPLYRRLVADLARLEVEWRAGAATRKAKADATATVRRDAERSRLLTENRHLVTKDDRPEWASRRLAAENIRRELKKRFPKVKFKVTSESFSMGNSVDVKWTDGPTAKEVEAITNRHTAGTFDGMTDCYEYDRDNVFGDLFGTAKYVHCQREWTLSAVRRANGDESIPETWAQDHDSSRVYWVHKAWSEMSF